MHLLSRSKGIGAVKIGGVYILVLRLIATITAALVALYSAATAQAESTIRRIHDATISLVSLDRQMTGRLVRTAVPDFMYLEYKSLYLELRPFRDFHGRVPPIVREPVASGAAMTVDDLQRAVEEVKRTVRKAKREIIEDAHTARASEADNRRVPTGERGKQITAVRKLIRKARDGGEEMSILRACRAVWRDVNGGYTSPEALYDYCHSHKTEF